MSTAQTLNLISLAKAGAGEVETVPGTEFSVQMLSEAQRLTTENELWLLALAGELIIDLPHGDFRVLKTGEIIRLEPGLKLKLTPLEPTVLLFK